MDSPAVIVFDVNETLSDMSPMATLFTDVGAPEHLARTWFALVLRDGFALTAAGQNIGFAPVAKDVLGMLLADVSLDRSVDDAVAHVMGGFGGLPPHPDVAPGVEALAGLGLRLVTLTNGSTDVAAGLLERAGLTDRFERLMSVEDAGAWKPAAAAYVFAGNRCGVAPEQMMLVAVHPWDIDGAHRAGLRTAWINRGGGPYPGHFAPPDTTVSTVTGLADELSR